MLRFHGLWLIMLYSSWVAIGVNCVFKKNLSFQPSLILPERCCANRIKYIKNVARCQRKIEFSCEFESQVLQRLKSDFRSNYLEL